MTSIGKILITIVAIWGAFGAYIFDISPSHLYNPLWPPHAKYHNAQTMLFGTCLGFLSLWFIWFQKGKKQDNIRLSAILASLYWITQIGAILFPGTALFDPEFAPPGNLPIQLIMDVVMLSILGIAYTRESKNLKQKATISIKEM